MNINVCYPTKVKLSNMVHILIDFSDWIHLLSMIGSIKELNVFIYDLDT